MWSNFEDYAKSANLEEAPTTDAQRLKDLEAAFNAGRADTVPLEDVSSMMAGFNSLWMRVPSFGDKINKTTRNAITEATQYLNICLDNTRTKDYESKEKDIDKEHVDSWLDAGTHSTAPFGTLYAKFVVGFLRQPAWRQLEYKLFTRNLPLLAVYKGEVFQVEFASRMGTLRLGNGPNCIHVYPKDVQAWGCEVFDGILAAPGKNPDPRGRLYLNLSELK